MLMLSGDVEPNPGSDTLSFCYWNLNSIIAYDFLRVSLIETYNSICNHDLIGVVGTHLDDTIDEERQILKGYDLSTNNHPSNTKRGRVGLYIKETLPKTNRTDIMTLPECVVCELCPDRKKYFFVVVYRSPSQDQQESENFMFNFELMLSKMSTENPYAVIITRDFNYRSTQWWANDNENDEGKSFEKF